MIELCLRLRIFILSTKYWQAHEGKVQMLLVFEPLRRSSYHIRLPFCLERFNYSQLSFHKLVEFVLDIKSMQQHLNFLQIVVYCLILLLKGWDTVSMRYWILITRSNGVFYMTLSLSLMNYSKFDLYPGFVFKAALINATKF